MATASHHRCGAGYRVECPYPLPVYDSLTAPSPEVGVKHRAPGRLPRLGYVLSVPRWWTVFRPDDIPEVCGMP